MTARGPFVVLAVLILVAAACGGGTDPDGSGAATSAGDPTSTEAPTSTEVAPPVEVPLGAAELVWSASNRDVANPGWDVKSIAVAPDGSTVAVGGFLAVVVHDLGDGAVVRVDELAHSALDLALTPDGTVLGVAVNVYADLLVEADTGTVLRELGSGYDSRIAISPDGTRVATSGREAVLQIWAVPEGTLVDEMVNRLPLSDESAADAVARYVAAVEFHPSGELVALTHFDCEVQVFDLAARQVVRTLGVDDGRVDSTGLSPATCWPSPQFVFAPDGDTMLAAVHVDGGRGDGQLVAAVRSWAVAGSDPIAEFEVDGGVEHLALSPDGSLLLVASPRGVTLWDPATGSLRYRLGQGSIGEFTPDGGHVVIGGGDGNVSLWRLLD